MRKLVILDRDGVINRDSIHYIKTPDELVLIPGSVEAIARLNAHGYSVAIATNQSGVSRGLYDEAQLHAINHKLKTLIQAAGGRIDALEYCPHMPDTGCGCRKPAPGMLRAIGEQLNCSLKDIPFIGDRISDIQAALAVEARPMIVLSQMTDTIELSAYPKVPVYHSLAECVDVLLGNDE